MEKPATPNLDKMIAVQEKSILLSEFLEWLTYSKHYTLCVFDDHPIQECWYPASYNGFENLLGEFFEVDVMEADRERGRLLDYVRSLAEEKKNAV